MTPEQKQQLDDLKIRHRMTVFAFEGQEPPQAQRDIDFLLSLVSQEAEDDDGSADWCDDCHGYTHKYDCPNRRYQAKTLLVERVVDAVYRSMSRYESGEWRLDTLKANARVKRLLAESDAATAMRSTCVEKVKAWADQHNHAFVRDVVAKLYAELESVSIQEQEKI